MLKSFPSHKDHRAALIQPSAEAASPRGECVAWNACLAPSLRQYQFILLSEQRHMCVNNLPLRG